MRDLAGSALPTREAFVSVCGHETAVVPGQGGVFCRRAFPLAPILPVRSLWLSPTPIAERGRHSGGRRALSRRYLKPGFGRLRCSRRGWLCAFAASWTRYLNSVSAAGPVQVPLVAAVFRTKRLLHERCSATCPRRRRPGQARRRQGRLQITVMIVGGCPGGGRATSPDRGILWRVVGGGARSRPSLIVSGCSFHVWPPVLVAISGRLRWCPPPAWCVLPVGAGCPRGCSGRPPRRRRSRSGLRWRAAGAGRG